MWSPQLSAQEPSIWSTNFHSLSLLSFFYISILYQNSWNQLGVAKICKRERKHPKYKERKYLQKYISQFIPCNPCTKDCTKEITVRTRLKWKVPWNTGKRIPFHNNKQEFLIGWFKQQIQQNNDRRTYLKAATLSGSLVNASGCPTESRHRSAYLRVQ